MISCIALHPEDPYLIAAVGVHYLRQLRVVGGRCEEVGLMKRLLERVYVLRECKWASKELLVVRGETEVTVMKGSSIRQTVQVTTSASITQLEVAPGGLLVATDDGVLHSYALNSAPTKLTQNLVYLPPTAWPLHRSSLQSMRLNPAGTLLAVCVDGVGLCSVPMTEDAERTLTPQLRTQSPVTCMHHAEPRGVVVTGHADHSVAVYRELTTTSAAGPPVIHHVFAELPLAVAMHRDGQTMLVAFPSQVGFFHVLHSAVKLSHSIVLPTRIVQPVHLAYSHGHDRLALTTGVHCFVYDAHEWRLLHHVTGASVLSGVRWTGDDGVLVTVNLEGGVMGYDGRMQRVLDEVEKGVEYQTLDTDWGVDYADLTERRIRAQIKRGSSDPLTPTAAAAAVDDAAPERAVILASGVHNGVTNRVRYITRRQEHGLSSSKEVVILPPADADAATEQLLRHAVLTALVIDTARKVVVAATASGHVLLLSYPVQTDVEYRTHLLHAAALHEQHGIAHMAYLRQAGTIVTVGSDGHLLSTDIGTLDLTHHPHSPQPALPLPLLTPYHLAQPKLLPRPAPPPPSLPSAPSPFSSAYLYDPDVIQLRLSAYLHVLSQCKSSGGVDEEDREDGRVPAERAEGVLRVAPAAAARGDGGCAEQEAGGGGRLAQDVEEERGGEGARQGRLRPRARAPRTEDAQPRREAPARAHTAARGEVPRARDGAQRAAAARGRAQAGDRRAEGGVRAEAARPAHLAERAHR